MREMKDKVRQMIHQILQALIVTKMTGMHLRAVFPFPIQLALMTTSLLMTMQQFLRCLVVMTLLLLCLTMP
jgi:hypothetical protein